MASELELQLHRRFDFGLRRIAGEVLTTRNDHKKKILSARSDVLNQAELDPRSGTPKECDPHVLRLKELELQLFSFDEAVLKIWSKLPSGNKIDRQAPLRPSSVHRSISVENVDMISARLGIYREIYRLQVLNRIHKSKIGIIYLLLIIYLITCCLYSRPIRLPCLL
jgi:hypothetical protein